MDRQAMRRLVATARVGRLATVRADGRPHVVPVCFVLDGDPGHEVVHSAVDAKPKRHLRLQRLADIRATGAASLLVDEYDDDWSRLWWVRLDGPARIVADGGEASRAFGSLARKYPQYAEDPPPGPVLAIDVERWTGWAASAS